MKKALLVGGLLAATIFTGCVQSASGVNAENTANLTTTGTTAAQSKTQKDKNTASVQAKQNDDQLANKMSDTANKMADKAIDKAADKIGEAGERLMDKMINRIFRNF